MKPLIYFYILLNYNFVMAKTFSCPNKISQYNIVPKSSYSYQFKKKLYCFFAFYTLNPEIQRDLSGSGNLDKTMWYAYYQQGDIKHIKQFPKPPDFLWSGVCKLKAVSFIDIDGDGLRDVTVIGSCDQHDGINYNFPFVFSKKNTHYALNYGVYSNLYGFLNLNISDIQKYFQNPDYYHTLRDRYSLIQIRKN